MTNVYYVVFSLITDETVTTDMTLTVALCSFYAAVISLYITEDPQKQ